MYTILSKRLASWITRIGLLALVVSLGLLGGPAKPAAAAAITVTVKPAGSGLEFSASYPYAVTWDVWLSTASIEVSPYPPHFATGGTLAPRVKHFATSSAVTSIGPAFYSLLPSTTYNYIVRAGDSYVTGSAKTLQSRVTVTFTQIEVIGDSDDFGKGELTFFFRNPTNGLFDRQFGEVSVSSGTFLQLPTERAAIIYRVFNKVGNLTLMVEGVDNDIDIDACRSNQPPDGTSGSDHCFDWATAQTAIYIPQFAGLSQNFTSKVVQFETTAYRLKFRVFAIVTAEYGELFAL